MLLLCAGLVLDAEDLGGGGGGGGGGERGGRLIVRKSDGSDCLRWKFTAPSNSADECSAVRVPRRSDGSLCCSIVLAAEPEPEAGAGAGAAEAEEPAEEPAEEYYDDSEFVTTRGSNKYREAAPIDAPSDTAGSSIQPNSSPSPSPVSAPAEDPADEEYDDSEFASTMGSGSSSSKQPAPIAPIAAADGALDPHPQPQPAVEEEEPLLSPAYEDDYNNDFVSPEPSPTKMSAVGFTKGAAAGSFLPSIPSCPTFLTPPTHPIPPSIAPHRTAPQ